VAEQPPQQPPPADQARRRAILIAQALAAGVVAGQGVQALAAGLVLTPKLLAMLTRAFLRLGYRRQTIRFALRVVTRVVRTPTPPDGPGATPGPAELATLRHERVFTAWFLERTTARVEAGYAAGMAEGEPEAREERFIDQHLDAQDRRRQAAQKVDAEAGKPGQVTDAGDDPTAPPRVILKWRAHPDDRTTPECRAADGAWFYADTAPIIGYPGMPHGGTCRCWPAHAGSLEAVARGRHVNEAVRGIISRDVDHRPHPGAATEDERQTA
jgi:hypothetical protein